LAHHILHCSHHLARLDVGEMKREMVGAMKDVMRQESVAQLCAQRARPSAHETTSENSASEGRREESAPPERAEAGTFRAEARANARVLPAVERETLTPVGVQRARDHRSEPNVSCLAPRATATPYSRVGPAMMGNMAAAERTPPFSDEDKGTSLKDWLNGLYIRRDNYNWTDEQLARLILECCKGRAAAALSMLPPQDRVRLMSVLRCLEQEFYSYAKQTASGLQFNTRTRSHGETEREYAVALQKLALYAYKDLPQTHLESRCKEQFLAGLRSRELQSHLGLFCSASATVQELVSCAEAFRATRNEANLISDEEGEAAAVTIAYTRSSRPGTTSKQWSKPAAGKEQEVGRGSDSDAKPTRRVKLSGHRQKIPPKECSGKCCFACGKQGHFARNCTLRNTCHHISEENLACEDKDHKYCECACGQHRHFLSVDDRIKVGFVLAEPAPST